MLQKMRNTDQKGFTLIELMIVIAIIGILAAIAIPNFISYRDKAFCSSAESDVRSIAAGLANYFAIPTNVSWTDQSNVGTVVFAGGTDMDLSGDNTADVTYVSTSGVITIEVTDGSKRCPIDYQNAVTGWNGAAGAGKFKQTM